jgi:hypothetical protein
MTARAYVERDILGRGVSLSLSPDENQLVLWQPLTITTLEPGVAGPADGRLYLPDDSARAIYEALADYFGHAGHDVRSLRKDYDAERRRVDQFIGHLLAEGRAV